MKSLIYVPSAVEILEIENMSICVGLYPSNIIYTKLKPEGYEINTNDEYLKNLLKLALELLKTEYNLDITGLKANIIKPSFSSYESTIIGFAISLFRSCGDNYEELDLAKFLSKRLELKEELMVTSILGNVCVKYEDGSYKKYNFDISDILVYELPDNKLPHEYEIPETIQNILELLINKNYFEEALTIYSSLLYSQFKMPINFIWKYYLKECYVGGNYKNLVVLSMNKYPQIFGFIGKKVWRCKLMSKIKEII